MAKKAKKTAGARACYLRATEVTLLDGRVYTFRALPFTRQTAGIIARLSGDSSSDLSYCEAILEAIEISLGYDQDAETVREVLESGALQIVADDSQGDAARVRDAVMKALL